MATTTETETGSILIRADKGSAIVRAYRCGCADDGIWYANVWVNQGEDITPVSGKFKTERGLRRWAAKVLNR